MKSAMGLFDKIKEPGILKKESSANKQLEKLQQLIGDVTDPKIKASLESEIKLVNAGIFGENTILFELQNSHIPMFVLHDLYLEYDGLTAQIDFLVITRGRIFVIECKNLYGDIAINDSGDFIRTVWSQVAVDVDTVISTIPKTKDRDEKVPVFSIALLFLIR
jgi:hypothetical protein